MPRLLLAVSGAFLLSLLTPQVRAETGPPETAACGSRQARGGKAHRGKTRSSKKAGHKRARAGKAGKKPRATSATPVAPGRPREAQGLKL